MRNLLPAAVKRALHQARALNIVLIGDAILDRYSFVQVLGLTSKNRTISTKRTRVENHPGGVLAVYRHLRALGCHPTLITTTGTELDVRQFLQSYDLGPNAERVIIAEAGHPTVVKEKFVEPSTDGLNKLFATSVIPPAPINPATEAAILSALEDRVPSADVVMAIDFGHGLMTERVRNFLQVESRFLALNCQTNSANHGQNIINQQYQRADAFSLDHQEINLANHLAESDPTAALLQLGRQLNAHYAWLTLGATETIGVRLRSHPGRICRIPALAQHVVDPVGAGDAFFSSASLMAAAGADISIATALSQVSGAVATQIVGNRDPVSLQQIQSAWHTLQPKPVTSPLPS